MTRPIKFKVFIKQEAKVNQSYFNSGRIGRIFYITKIDFENETISFDCPSETILSFDEVEIMQFTGLHDSTAKEIYEFDILQSNTGRPLVVEWCGSMFRWILTINDEYYENLSTFGDEYPLIGNKFTHPELLEK